MHFQTLFWGLELFNVSSNGFQCELLEQKTICPNTSKLLRKFHSIRQPFESSAYQLVGQILPFADEKLRCIKKR